MRRLGALAVQSLIAIWRRQNEFGKALMVIGAVNVAACLLLAFNLVIYSALPWRSILAARQAWRVPTPVPTGVSTPWPTPTNEPTPRPTLPPTPTLTPTPTRTPTVTPTRLPTLRPVPRIEVTAKVNDESPRRNSVVTVTGRITEDGKGIAGVPMRTEWLFQSVTMYCDDRTNGDGVGKCSFPILLAARRQKVIVRVAFEYEGQTYTTETSFTPR